VNPQTQERLAFDGQDWQPIKSPAPADPIKEQVRAEMAKETEAGLPQQGGLSDQALQGMTFGFGDEILAGLRTPLEMIQRHTLNPAKAYDYAKARQDVALEDARKRSGALGTAAEILGGIGSGSGLARAGATLIPRIATASLGRRAAGLAGDSAIYGGLSGFGSGTGLEDRLAKGAAGAAVGGAVGGATGLAAPVASALGRNVMGWSRAAANPKGYANSQLARALMESGKTPQDVARSVAAAAAEGQPYALADALGNPGQRMLSAVTRAPGEGRTAAVDFLESRQAGQGRRIANALSEGLQAPNTSAQTEAALRSARSAAAAVNYGAARDSAISVKVYPVLDEIDKVLRSGAKSQQPLQIGENSIQSTLERLRDSFKAPNGRADFNYAFNVKLDLDDAISRAAPRMQQVLIPIRNRLDEELAQASAPYANARNAYREASRTIDAVDTGRSAAQRGRVEDTIPAFRGLSPSAQTAFRSGYADPLIAQVQGGASGVNKARPFTSDAYQAELHATAPLSTGNRMMRRLGRENEMFETRAHALGGSRTADNLADAESLASSPEILANLASGNFLTAGKNLVSRSLGGLSGNTPAVRKSLADLLTTTGKAPNLQAILDSVITDEQTRRFLQAAILRGLAGGGAVGVPAISQSSAR
jgi:hypothetical protein